MNGSAEILGGNNTNSLYTLQWGNITFELPPEMFLNPEWKNFSHMMNLSIDNLTDFIVKAQRNMQRDAMPILTTITVFYSLIFIAGVLGNLITCIVISRNKSMHTATNYYLFNLAISDLILLLSGMPPDLFNIWYPFSYPFSDPICILEGILSETAANATVLTITAFTVERYIAICHPFRQHTMSKLSRAVKFILAIWVTAFILAMPQAMQFGIIDDKGGTMCSVKDDYIGHVFAVSGFVFFVGPMTAICVLYVLIGAKLKKSKLLQGIKRKGCDVNRGISAQTRVIRMLIAVAVAFFLCWAPFHAQRLMAVYGSTVDRTTILFDKIYTALTYISGVMYFLSTCINPLLYNIMSYKFRDAFKMTLARHFGLANKLQIQNHNYSALIRQNGSIRLNTTVNNRQDSYSILPVQKRESNLSLQDIARARSAHRQRCVSVSSQSTLLTSLSKNDVFAANNCPGNNIRTPTDNQISCIEDQQQQHHHIGGGEVSVDGDQLQELPHFRRKRQSLPFSATIDSTLPEQSCELNSSGSGSGGGGSKDSTIVALMPLFKNGSDNSRNRTDSGISILSRQINQNNNNNGNASCAGNNHHHNHQHNHHTSNDSTTRKLSHENIPPAIKSTKLSALESLSEKLRKGTRKVLFSRSNNSPNMVTSPTTPIPIAPRKSTVLNFSTEQGH